MGHLRGVSVSNTRAVENMRNMRMEYKVDGVEVKKQWFISDSIVEINLVVRPWWHF